ncbi:MAG TPA: hypothetical protein VEX88_12485 [Glaciibacter sp.]|nr:hypothetical protein [Glaciibacter sp.]
MNPLRTRLTVAVAGIVLALTTLAGCASAPPELQETAAANFQLSVLDVTTAAKAGDYASAQAALDELQADLLTATAAEQVSGTRAAQIQSAINAVADDLADAIQEAKDKAAAQAIADAEAAKDAPAPPSDEKGNDDNKGEGNGEGDDKGKDDDCKKDKDDC